MFIKNFFKKNKVSEYKFNAEKVREVTLEGEQKIREKAEKWIEENWIEQNILEAAALGRHSYTFNKVPKELADYVRTYFSVRGFSVFTTPVPPSGKDNGTRTLQIIW